MPLKLNVGLSKKIGLPDYGSLGASCHVEVELAHDVVFSDLETFHRHVASAFVACRQAVQDELARHSGPANGESSDQGRNGRDSPSRSANGRAARRSGTNGASREGAYRDGAAARVSQKQLDYARQLAGQIVGLGVRRLETLAQTMFGKPVADLTILDASNLIDTLKDLKSGKIDVATALDGAATDAEHGYAPQTHGAAA